VPAAEGGLALRLERLLQESSDWLGVCVWTTVARVFPKKQSIFFCTSSSRVFYPSFVI
jgi:hypothetical protein